MRLLNSIRKQSSNLQTDNLHYSVTWDDLLVAHRRALRVGGIAGVLNENSLRSAIARPYCGYFESIHEKAAALLEGVVKNHGFADGNKRTALLITGIFIINSGHIITATYKEYVNVIVNTAAGTMSFDDLKLWFEQVLISRDSLVIQDSIIPA